MSATGKSSQGDSSVNSSDSSLVPAIVGKICNEGRLKMKFSSSGVKLGHHLDCMSIAGVDWIIDTEVDQGEDTSENSGRLSMYMFCNSSHFGPSWSLDVNYVVHIVGANASLCIKGSHWFGPDHANLFVESFPSWKYVVDYNNGFLDDKNEITLLLDFFVKGGADEPEGKNALLFGADTSFCSDCVLLVDDRQVHVSRGYLGMHSSFFRNMFESNFRERDLSQIRLGDVHFNEFIELLSVLYLFHYPITANNVMCLLRLGDRFDMPAVLELCKGFLWNDVNCLRDSLKLWLAQEYHFDDLQERCTSRCKSISYVVKLKHEPEFGWFTDKTKALLFTALANASEL